jgi:ribosome biogenesis GTPase / thiamine phosphate phosphatase
MPSAHQSPVNIFKMSTLEQYGWNDFFSQYEKLNRNKDFVTGRVISVKGFKYHLMLESGETEAELSGKLLFGTDHELLPKVGDWVFCLKYDTTGYITEVYPRINMMARKNPGNTSERQILAANIDYAMIVQGLDRDFNLMRLDRYLVQIIANGVNPIIVLNKADLVDDREAYRNEILRLGKDCPIYFCSAYDGSGLEELLNQILLPAKTYIMVGSSGVGKSTLLNSFRKSAERATGPLSTSTNKGMHVTTTRDLFKLPNGSLIIDTPGMKEFGIALEDGLQTDGLFPSIDEFAGKCRYANCKHINEEGCAVIEAYENQLLDPTAYNSYIKLIKEQKRFEIRAGESKRLGKQFGKMVREAKDFRNKYKY